MADIEIDVGLDITEFNSKIDLLTGAFETVIDTIGRAVDDFGDFEDKARDMGRSLQELAGFTDDVTDSYREFERTTERIKRLNVNLFAGAIKEANELGTVLGNAFTPILEMLNKGDSLGSVLGAAATAASDATGDFLGNFGFGLFGDPSKRARRVTDQEAEQRAKARERRIQNEIRKINDEAAQALTEAEEQAASQRTSLRQRFFDRGRRDARRDDLFDQFQEIDRNAFLATQRLNFQDKGLRSAEDIRAENKRALEAFDIRQKAQGEKRDLQKAERADEAQIKMADGIDKISTTLEAAVTEILANRQEQADNVEFLQESVN